MEAKDGRFKILITHSETQLIKFLLGKISYCKAKNCWKKSRTVRLEIVKSRTVRLKIVKSRTVRLKMVKSRTVSIKTVLQISYCKAKNCWNNLVHYG